MGQRRNAHSLVLALAIAGAASATPAAHDIPQAFGPHVNLNPADFAEAKSFLGTDRIIGTYYFYWYDTPSKAHIVDGDGTDALTTHPRHSKG